MIPSAYQNLRSMVLPACIAFILLASASIDRVPAQSPTAKESVGQADRVPNPPRRSLDASSLTDQLSTGSYSSRRRATMEMWGARDQLREQVQEAARHEDPEVAGRANWILSQWRRGALPGMPPNVIRLLQQGDDPAAIQELVEFGKFGAAVIAIEESAASIEFEAIKERVSKAISTRFPFYVKHAIEKNSLHDLLSLVDIAATDESLAVCRVRLMGEMGIAVSDDDLLPRAAKSWTPLDRHRATIILMAIRDRYEDAMKLAEQEVLRNGSSSENFLFKLLAMSGEWQSLADRHFRLAKDADEETASSRWINALVASDRCGDQVIRQAAIDALVANGETLIDTQRWKALAMHGEVDIALELISDRTPEAFVDVALAASQPERALQGIGFPVEDLNQKIDQWIADAIKAQKDASASGTVSIEVRRLVCLMKCLLAVGRESDAWEVANQLSQANISVGSRRNTNGIRDFVVQNLISTTRSDWVFDLAVLDGEKSVSQTAQWCAARVLPDVETTTITHLMNAMLTMNRSLPFARRFRMSCDLLAGEVPDGFDPHKDFHRLYDHIANDKLSSFRSVVGMPLPTKLNHEIVTMFSKHGQSDLATKCLYVLMKQGDIEAIYELARQEADKGNANRADELYDLAWSRAHSKGHSNHLQKATDRDSAFAAKALIGQWFLARRSRDEEQSELLRRHIELMLCSPSAQFLNEVAEFLGERGELEMARDAYQVLLPLTTFSLQSETDFYDVARGYATLVRESNAKSAIAWFDLAISKTVDLNYFRSSAYITLPLYISRWQLEAAIDSKNRGLAESSIQRILKLDQLDISYAEELLPKMREAQMTELADETFNVMFDQGRRYLKRFPLDATTGNNVAWVAAMNDMRLEEALELSEMTVLVEPSSAIYRDTLAEILFRLGRKREALHVEESCLLDDPTQWHLHQQIEKYRKAVAELP